MSKIFESKVYGDEPSWDGSAILDPDSLNVKIGKALNWYNYMSDQSEKKSWILSYMEETGFPEAQIAWISDLSPAKLRLDRTGALRGSFSSDAAVVARMLSRKAPLPERDREFVREAVEHWIAANPRPEPSTAPVAPKPSVKDMVAECASAIMGEVEQHIDKILCREIDLKKSTEWAKKKTDSIKPVYCEHIIRHFGTSLNEYEAVLAGTDTELSNAYYDTYGSLNVENTREFLKTLLNFCSEKTRIADAHKSVHVRKRKINPIKMVSKLKYLKECADPKLTSILPSKIIGAEKLVVYNAKYRVVTVYESMSEAGFLVKGTTLLNFDEKLSKSKKLRKPEEFFKAISGKGIRVVWNTFKGINSVEKTPTGRINDETVLVSVY